jgi:hypothetical protein
MADQSKFKLVATDHGRPVYDYAFDETDLTDELKQKIRESIQSVVKQETHAFAGSFAVGFDQYDGASCLIPYRAVSHWPSHISIEFGGLTPFKMKYEPYKQVFSVEDR